MPRSHRQASTGKGTSRPMRCQSAVAEAQGACARGSIRIRRVRIHRGPRLARPISFVCDGLAQHAAGVQQALLVEEGTALAQRDRETEVRGRIVDDEKGRGLCRGPKVKRCSCLLGELQDQRVVMDGVPHLCVVEGGKTKVVHAVHVVELHVGLAAGDEFAGNLRGPLAIRIAVGH